MNDMLGIAIIMGACLSIWFITYLKKKSPFLTGCIVRLGGGMGTVFLMNYLFAQWGIPLFVGIGPLSILTSVILGFPGVCVLYGILLI